MILNFVKRLSSTEIKDLIILRMEQIKKIDEDKFFMLLNKQSGVTRTEFDTAVVTLVTEGKLSKI